MKKTNTLFWIAAGLLMILPGISFSQDEITPAEKIAKMHNEVPDDPWIPGPAGAGTRSQAARVDGSGFTMVQVNVDGSGQNIIGDAANEPSIAISPVDPNVIVIGWRQFDNVTSNFRQAGWGYTVDGGLTWTFPGVIDQGVFRSDPVLDADADGMIYYNSLTSNSSVYTCKVFKSSDGGASWNNGADARGGDKQWMTIDRTSGPGAGNIYSFWTSYYSSCYPDFFTRSTDGGLYFESCSSIPGNPYWGTMAVGNDGELYIGGAGDWGGLMVTRSSNAQVPGSTITWDLATPVDLDGYINASMPVNPVGLVGQASIDVDRSNGPGRDNVYVLASVTRFSNGDTADVMFSKSTDGGLSWSLPRRINDDPGTAAYQWFGTMSVAPNGRIDVIWLDTRDAIGANPHISALYYSHSEDQGETWSVNERLSDFFDPHLGYPAQDKMGDYFDLYSENSFARLAWANTLNGEEDVYYSEITPVIDAINPGNEHGICYLSGYPNPFRTEVAIRYQVPVTCDVSVTVTDVYGRVVKILADQEQKPGSYSVTLAGDDLPAGYYICNLNAGTFFRTLKLVKV